MRRSWLNLSSAVAVLVWALGWLGPRAAAGNEYTDIASAFDTDNPFSIFAGVDYSFAAKRASIKRELSGPGHPEAPPDTIPIVKDLVFAEDRHIITPHLQLGIFHDVELRFSLPITLALNRSYDFDQRADPCTFPSMGGMATCVDRTNSSTLGDHILPDGTSGKIGYDANDPTTGFDLNSKTVFRSPGRSGLDQLHIGLSWAPMNQARDDTKPTWILGAEVRISVGQIMKLDAADPQSQTGVSTGVHEFRAQTSISKRTSWAEPFVMFWWQAPIGVRGDNARDPDSSLFWNVGFGQREHSPQQQAGTMFGFDATLWENPKEQQRINLGFVGTVMAHFAGLGYSEMWEIFACGGDPMCDPGAPLRIRLDPTDPSSPIVNHPGVTSIENYMSFAGRIGVNGQIGPHAKFSVAFDLGRDQSHAISYTDAGTVFPACGPMNPAPNCEGPPADNVVTPGTREVNPLHVQLIDVAGRRFIVDEATTYTVLVQGELLF